MNRQLSLSLSLLLLCLPGCDDQGQDPGTCESTYGVDERARPLLDVLFVVDASPSMAQLANQMATNVARFAEVLENAEGGLPDVRIGVVSANVGAGGFDVAGCTGDGDGGRLIQPAAGPGCTAPEELFIASENAPWFTCGNASGVPCQTNQNYPGELAEALACVVPAPGSCEFSQPFEAMKRALDGSVPENTGFLRDDAFLAVIFITDDDDCSAEASLFDPDDMTYGPLDTFRCARAGIECAGSPLDGTPGTYAECTPTTAGPMRPVSDYVDFLKGLKPDPSLVVVSAITGSGGGPDGDTVTVIDDGQPALAPACNSADVAALPAIRLDAFARALPQRHVLTASCESDYSNAFIMLTDPYQRVLGYPCYPDVAIEDSDPGATGLQLPCTVLDSSRDDPSVTTEVPRCLMADDQTIAETSPTPCWWAYDNGSGDPTCRLRIIVERASRSLLDPVRPSVSCPLAACEM